ncbi:glycosyltransferase family 4 protein [Novosphingobium sp. YJ-S2-02]|uniref:Glycosyltransferase family 4 protein n=1 Tax=Novosphingobium aureum TaxID=2792964 RepID=A0A931HDW9_9SPHN|nr:glycosyltransferase family 4 protein [Novosphingobium aureum]MBH0114330.1 glycosyltransferase family 4 protein [Novosphingobium aureum]
MPNLLSLNSYHYPRGGSDVVYLEHAGMFEAAGWNNTFFSMKHPRNLPCKDERHFTETVDWEFASGALDKARSALASVYNREARSKLRALIAERKPDIAHAHCIYHHLTPAVFPVLAEAGVPIVLTAHDLKLACPAYKMMNADGICERCRTGGRWNVVTNRCIKNSLAASAVVGVEAYVHALLGSYRKHLTRVVAPSRFYRDKLIEWGWEAERIAYIPNFVPPADDRFTGGYEGNILYFGRLSEEKGLATLVRAAAASGVPVDLVGTGPQREELEVLIAELNAPVRLLGRLDGDALWTCVGQARAVVLPSEWYENAPMSALEAMQLARPVIGADIGGIPELLNESGAGTSFPSGDVAALAGELARFQTMSASDLSALGQVGSQHVRREFSRERYVERMQALYSDCMA